jgi:hypothetical protein
MIANPKDHYWAIGGSTTEVYSSKTGTVVPVDNPDFIEWLNLHSFATPIADDAELDEVLVNYGVPRPAR